MATHLPKSVPSQHAGRLYPLLRARLMLPGAFVLLAIGIIGYFTYRRFTATPEHRLERFCLALSQGDYDGLFTLTNPAEVQRLRISPQKFRNVLHQLTGGAKHLAIVNSEYFRFNEPQSRYNKLIKAKLAVDGSPLPGATDGIEGIALLAYKKDGSWSISLSRLLYSIVLYRYGRRQFREVYLNLCQQYDLSSELYQPESDEWIDLRTYRHK